MVQIMARLILLIASIMFILDWLAHIASHFAKGIHFWRIRQLLVKG
jgi:hypothetical protein